GKNDTSPATSPHPASVRRRGKPTVNVGFAAPALEVGEFFRDGEFASRGCDGLDLELRLVSDGVEGGVVADSFCLFDVRDPDGDGVAAVGPLRVIVELPTMILLQACPVGGGQDVDGPFRLVDVDPLRELAVDEDEGISGDGEGVELPDVASGCRL